MNIFQWYLHNNKYTYIHIKTYKLSNSITGTGHGVGAALNVHEGEYILQIIIHNPNKGPQRISPVLDSQPLLPNMVVR